MIEPTAYLISACLLSYRILFRTVVQSSIASTIYTWLNRSRSYTSHSEGRTKPGGETLTHQKLDDRQSRSFERAPSAGNNLDQLENGVVHGDVIEMDITSHDSVSIRERLWFHVLKNSGVLPEGYFLEE